MNNIFKTITILFASAFCFSLSAVIPEWFKSGVENHIVSSETIVLYQTDSVELISKKHIYSVYKINTTTIKALKGSVAEKHCYYIHTEGDWEIWGMGLGEKSIAMLREAPDDNCSLIDTGYGAPGTQEYVDLFETILQAPNKQLNKDATTVAPIS